jgi:YggT family protein
MMPMAALIYLLETLLSLGMLAVLLRLLLQWSRADFRNSLARAIVHLTNPVIVPLRRLLPAIGRIDTASCVAVVIFALLQVSVSWLLSGFGPPPAPIWLRLAVIEILRTTLWTYFFAIFLYAMLSMVAPGTYSPAQGLLVSLCEPILRPFRRVIPPLAGLDLSPLWAGIVIQTLLILLRSN